MKVLLGVEDPHWIPEVSYAVRVMCACLGLQVETVDYADIAQAAGETSVALTYGSFPPAGGSRGVHVYPSAFFGPQYLTPRSLPTGPVPRLDGLPILFQGAGGRSELCIWNSTDQDVQRVETNLDIVASSFFLATRYEEIVDRNRDRCGRFPASASLAVREGFIDRPLVNEYAELLWHWISRVATKAERPASPWEGHSFAACVTHDIDHVRKYRWRPPLRLLGRHLLIERDLSRFGRTVVDYAACRLGRRKDPFDTFSYLCALEDRHGFTSTFFVFGGGSTRMDARYTLADPEIRLLLRSARSRGDEVGLHSSFESYKDPEMLRVERRELEAALGSCVSGVRQHFLRWEVPSSWLARSQAGFLYDASLTFPEHEGFRCGICTPYQAFDIAHRSVLPIWEIPTTVMDGSLRKYQDLPPEEGLKRILALIQTVRRHGGLFVLLWHNSSLDPNSWSGWRAVYEETLEQLHEQGALLVTLRDALKSWVGAIEDPPAG
jgi:peptidoglycan/xylan/chitin deacetylase (PgdA/CDA1 family)